MSKRDIHAEVTAQIIAALEAGTPPWRRPWGNGLGPALPRNAVSGHRYRGVNALLLAWHPLALASGDPRWCTYHQAQEKGWQVRKGEKGTAIIFFKKIEIDDDESDDGDNADPRFIPLIRTFVVFHASQMDGIPPWTRPVAPEQSWQAPETVKALLKASGVGASTSAGAKPATASPATSSSCRRNGYFAARKAGPPPLCMNWPTPPAIPPV